MNAIPQRTLNILLADDDIDDCLFFRGAIEKSPVRTTLTIVHDGKKLMQLLTTEDYILPAVLFLDLNMPRQNGFECLSEIKLHARLRQIPVIMFSTSNELAVVDRLFSNGAHYFIRKPSIFSQFEEIILQTLLLINKESVLQPSREDFVLMHSSASI